MSRNQLLTVCACAAFSVSNVQAADLGVKGDDLPRRFNLTAAAAGFPGTMVLQQYSASPSPSFRYALNQCIGLLGFSKGRKANLNSLMVIASGCKEKTDAAPLVSLLAFTGVICTDKSDRTDGAKMALNGLNLLSDKEPKQTVIIDDCKITLQRSEIVGFMMSVE